MFLILLVLAMAYVAGWFDTPVILLIPAGIVVVCIARWIHRREMAKPIFSVRVIENPSDEEWDEEAFGDDDDEDETFSGIDPVKERKRLEKVLDGLYNRRDKFEYQGKSKNTQAWKGLEYDIREVERRLKYFKGED